LQRILEENHVKLIFHIHPKLKEFLKEFHTEGKNVELAAFGVRPLNELLMECSMLVTDYSSVSWDACYMGKPVLFYQFDLEMYLKANGSYLDMDRELFGDRCLTQEELLDKILEYIHRDFREKEEYGRMRKKYFTYQDKNNSKRTLEFILKKGY
jgi:CDP-glycerol glycerophosphotransferase (TagB/SpsB family)